MKESSGNGKFLERLLKTRTILLCEEINPQTFKRVVESFLVLESDDPDADIFLLINSHGGDVSAGLGIYDMIKFIKPRVKILSTGLTASIAVVIFLGSPKERRFSLPNSKFMIHQPLLPTQVYGAASDLEITANEILKIRKRINLLISEETGQPLEKIEKDTERDFWLDAKEALEYGLIGKIVHSREEMEKV